MKTSHKRIGTRWEKGLIAMTLGIMIFGFMTPLDLSAQNRKGFILNLGLGGAVVSSKYDHPDAERTNQFGVGTDFKIGYAPTDRLLLYYSNDAAFTGVPEGSNQEGILATGLSGLGATYFLNLDQGSFYVDGAVGASARNFISTDDGAVDSDTGFGFSIGGGWEFAPHWLLDADLIFGKVDVGIGDLKTNIFRVGVIWLLY